jgi:glucose-6-phosphate isomerase
MFSLLSDYSKLLETAIKQARSSDAIFKEKKIDEILILGIGGSAMSGELLSSYLKNFKHSQWTAAFFIFNYNEVSTSTAITRTDWLFVIFYNKGRGQTNLHVSAKL